MYIFIHSCEILTEMADEAGTKKRKKSYYINSAKKKRFSLDAGQLI